MNGFGLAGAAGETGIASVSPAPRNYALAGTHSVRAALQLH